MQSSVVSALCLAAGLVIVVAPAPAQNYDPDRVPSNVDAEQRQACTPDVMRLCNDYVPNIPDIVACLKRERQNLSPACAVVFSVPEPEAAPPPQRATTKKKPTDTKAGDKKDAAKKPPAKAGPPLSLTGDTAKATR